jgi:hypothetical protein
MVTFGELRDLAEKSDKLVRDAIAIVQSRSSRMSLAASPPVADAVEDVRTGEPPRSVEPQTSTGAARPALRCVEPAEGGDSSDEPAANLTGIEVGDGD